MYGMLIALAPFLIAASSSAQLKCNPIPGWDMVLTKNVRWIVVGETHGSKEVPEIFADAVCLTAKVGPVVVAVEQPSIDQALIDKFLSSDGGPSARRAFLAALMWNGSMKDGRSSEAYFRLFEALRRMRVAGLISSVVAFQPSSFAREPGPEEYEKAMAALLTTATQPGTRVIALVGNVHAMRTKVRFQSEYLPMAAHLPRNETVTLNTVSNGGAYWVCTQACGPTQYPVRADRTPRGVVLSASEGGSFSGTLNTGVVSTASPPQKSPSPQH